VGVPLNAVNGPVLVHYLLTKNRTRYVWSEYGVSLNLSVNWSQISATHVVHSVYFANVGRYLC
jgi:hypothetical protein